MSITSLHPALITDLDYEKETFFFLSFVERTAVCVCVCVYVYICVCVLDDPLPSFVVLLPIFSFFCYCLVRAAGRTGPATAIDRGGGISLAVMTTKLSLLLWKAPVSTTSTSLGTYTPSSFGTALFVSDTDEGEVQQKKLGCSKVQKSTTSAK